MPSYTPPVNEAQFLLKMLKADRLRMDIPEYSEYDRDTITGMIDAAAEFAEKEAFPLDVVGDQKGCKYDSQTRSVTTPPGFKEAYDAFRKLGLMGPDVDERYGGMQTQRILSTIIDEYMCGANFSLATYPGLTLGALKAIDNFATDEIKDLYGPKLLSGDWTGTMCLTESDAGTDLGLLRTKAVPQDDGSYAVEGEKIFISCGEHDLSENIVHLVLARLPGAPKGHKGISLFVVPKFVPGEDGTLAEEPNNLHCSGLWEKMGIHGSSTCTMQFEGAKGWLVGEENEGLKAMFSMMNDARMKVALQGLGIAEKAYQNAALYADERIQGASIDDKGDPDAPSIAIINHANIKSHLVEMRGRIESFRALVYNVAIHMDRAKRHPVSAVRENSDAYITLMTPILKAGLTDLSVDAAKVGMQIHGGAGFITETGVEQLWRDAIIGTIYEGTNDIQAMDFIFRKYLDTRDLGCRVGTLMAPIAEDIAEAKKDENLAPMASKMEQMMRIVQDTSKDVLQKGMSSEMDELLANSYGFMDMYRCLATGHMSLKIMKEAHENLARDGLSDEQKAFYETKILVHQAHIERTLMPEMKKLEFRAQTGAAAVHGIDPKNLLPVPGSVTIDDTAPAPEDPKTWRLDFI